MSRRATRLVRSTSVLVLWIALCAAPFGCRSPSDGSRFRGMPAPPAAPEPDPTGRIEERRELDERTGALEHEWTVLVTPGRGAIRHGVERAWYPSGALHWEREFRFGKPTGIWRSWYEDGRPRTECAYLGPDVPRTMSFWREDGKLSAQGPACDGARQGTWRFWWRNGRLAEEGEYREGSRQGAWRAWSEDGEVTFERVYEKDVRISQRELPQAQAAEASARPDPAGIQ